MIADATMNARNLMGDWLELGDVPNLLGDIDEMLKSQGIGRIC